MSDAEVERLKQEAGRLEAEARKIRARIRAATASEMDRQKIKREQEQTCFSVCKQALFHVGAFASEAMTQSATKLLTEDGAHPKFMKFLSCDHQEFAKQVEAFETGAPRVLDLMRRVRDAWS